MKKLVLAALLLGTAGASAFAQAAITLDEAIRQGAERIGGALPRGTKIAVLNFSSASEPERALSITGEVTAALVKDGAVTLVDRRKLDAARKEISAGGAEELSNEAARETGRKLGAQVVVNGSLTTFGSNYRFLIQALDVETPDVYDIASFYVERVMIAAAKETPPPPPPPDAPPEPEAPPAAVSDFTAEERALAVVWNLAFGLGSIAILDDVLGFAVGGIGGEVYGAVCMIIGGATNTDELFWTGVGFYAAGFVFSSVCALIVHRPGYVAAADRQPPFAVALVPAHNGGTAMRVSYTYSY